MNPTDWKDVEIARLKSQLDVSKHYYETLFGKNLAKIEQVVKSLDDSIRDYRKELAHEDEIKEIRDLEKKIAKKTTKSSLKKVYKRQIELLTFVISIQNKRYDDNKTNWNLLRQVM